MAGPPPANPRERAVRAARMGSSYGSFLNYGVALMTGATRRQQQEKSRVQAPMDEPDRHLDLGCGRFPRNPYARRQLCGVDIRPLGDAEGFDYRVANLIVQPIPYPDRHFASVSAFDFIEHVPRVFPGEGGTIFPFVRLMDEIWRVLAPGGRLYALTPAFPAPEAFTDPTHVNIITDKTHEYFCGDKPMGRMYGFQGSFELVRCEWVSLGEHYSAIPGSPENRKPRTGIKRAAEVLRNAIRRLSGRSAAAQKRYLLWELEARKDDGGHG
jgi:SAM-dependent methyltransferase